MEMRPGCMLTGLVGVLIVTLLLCCACAVISPAETTLPEATQPEPTQPPIQVTYQPNNGDPLVVVDTEKGALATGAPTPQKRACEFAGWFCGDRQWDFAKDTVSESVTLTARWTLAENAFDPDPNAGTRAEGTDLRVCSFNTLLSSVGSMHPVSPKRDAAFSELINAYAPDIIALQEQGEDWFTALLGIFTGTDYKMITGSHPTFGLSSGVNNMAYNSAVLELVEANIHEYLVGRNMVWAVFETKDAAKQKILALSTHWTTIEDDMGRVIQAKEMLKQVGKIKEKYPDALVIAMGDFNSWDSFGSYSTVLTEGNMTDAKYAANKRGLAAATSHSGLKIASFNEEKINTAESIDHIFLSEGIASLYYDTIIDARIFVASDHCPIYADVKLVPKT